MEVRVVNISEKLSQFTDCWNPRVVSHVNDTAVKLAKLSGEFVWHRHDHEDEMFLVVSGELKMRVRDDLGERELLIRPGEFVTIPRAVEHLPIAEREVHVMLIEPDTTLNTGNIINERTRAELETI